MKNSPEVTTALALMAERMTRDKWWFSPLSVKLKSIALHSIASGLLDQFHIRDEQIMEFLERYNDTIIKPWCCEYLENDAS